MIKVTNNLEEASFVTHSGNFHADEVFGTVFLSKIYGDITVARLNSYLDDGSKIAYDIGLGKFDHHQLNDRKVRSNGIHYCGFGLLWQELGLDYLKSLNIENPSKTFQVFDYLLVNMIDAIDNGEFSIDSEYNVYTLTNLIELFRPKFNEEKDENESFLEAVNFANLIFDLVLKDAINKTLAIDIIKAKIPTIENKILVLEEFVPFEYAIFDLDLDVDFVIYPSNRGGFATRTIPTYYDGNIPRKPFLKAWAGLRHEELQKVSGIKTAMFCHNNVFLFISGNLEDAKKAALLSMDN